MNVTVVNLEHIDLNSKVIKEHSLWNHHWCSSGFSSRATNWISLNKQEAILSQLNNESMIFLCGFIILVLISSNPMTQRSLFLCFQYLSRILKNIYLNIEMFIIIPFVQWGFFLLCNVDAWMILWCYCSYNATYARDFNIHWSEKQSVNR